MNVPINAECIKNYYREYSEKTNNKDTEQIFSEASTGSLNIMQTLAGLNCNIYQPHEKFYDDYKVDTLNFELQLKEEYQDNIFVQNDDNLQNSIQFSRYVLNPNYWDSQGTVFGTDGFPEKRSTRGMKWNLILKGDLLYIIFRGSCYDEVIGGNYHSRPLISVQRVAEQLGNDIQLDEDILKSILENNKSRYTIDEVNTNKEEGKQIQGDKKELDENTKIKYKDLHLDAAKNQVWYEELFTPCLSMNYACSFLYMNNRLKDFYLPFKQARQYTDPIFGSDISNLNLSGFLEIMSDIYFEDDSTEPPGYILNANRDLHYLDYEKMSFEDIRQQYNNICNYNGERSTGFKEIEQDLFFYDIITIHNSIKEIQGIEGEGLKGIIVSGHSRGGGMSFISSLFLRNHKYLKDIPIATLPFAPVSPGNYLFGNLYNRTNIKYPEDIGMRVYLDWDQVATSSPKLKGGKKSSKKKYIRNKSKRGGNPTQLSLYNAIQYYLWSQPNWGITEAIIYLLEHQQVMLEHTSKTRSQWENDIIWKDYLSNPVDGIFLSINSRFDTINIRVDDISDKELLNKKMIPFTSEDIDRIVNENGFNQDLLNFFLPDRNLYDAKVREDNAIKRNIVQGGKGEHSMGKLATLIFILNIIKDKNLITSEEPLLEDRVEETVNVQWNNLVNEYFKSPSRILFSR
jgi:hypothetical protein